MWRHILKQLWTLFWYAVVGLVENAVFGWGDAKLGISNETVERAVQLLMQWGIPALTVLAFMGISEYVRFARWKRERVPTATTPSAPRPPKGEFVPMTEAATLVYEEARKVGSLWAYAAERLGARGLTGSSSEDEILNYMATFIAGKIPIFGCKPPSRIIEELAGADKRNGVFQNRASEFRFLPGRSPTYTNLQVKSSDLDSVIKYIGESHKADASI